MRAYVSPADGDCPALRAHVSAGARPEQCRTLCQPPICCTLLSCQGHLAFRCDLLTRPAAGAAENESLSSSGYLLSAE